MNQSEFLAITCNSHKARENRADMVRLFLALLVFGLETGGSFFLSQSLRLVIAIA